MKYLLSHRTTYSYASSVDSAHHIAHLRARAFPGQTVDSIGIATNPVPAMAIQHVDHFGNHIDIYRIDKPHTRFDIEVRAAVDVRFPEPPPFEATPAWEAIRAAARIGRRIKADFEYHPGATDISTPLAEVFAGKAGVCQDFAHVQIAALRAHGLAAGYVSGYIRTIRSKDDVALRGADASHAWVAVWCGEAAGWVHLDPTNDLVVSEDHVAVAWGRDFSDVSPLRGVILGGGAHSVEVAVTVSPLEGKGAKPAA